MASAGLAVAMVCAGAAPVVGHRVDRGGPVKRIPSQLARGLFHMVEIIAAAKMRHRILALPRPLEDITLFIDRAFYIAGFAGDADFTLGDVVIRFQVVVADGPVLDRRPLGNVALAIAPGHFTDSPEIPRFQPP